VRRGRQSRGGIEAILHEELPRKAEKLPSDPDRVRAMRERAARSEAMANRNVAIADGPAADGRARVDELSVAVDLIVTEHGLNDSAVA
jgi:hypothetical protein